LTALVTSTITDRYSLNLAAAGSEASIIWRSRLIRSSLALAAALSASDVSFVAMARPVVSLSSFNRMSAAPLPEVIISLNAFCAASPYFPRARFLASSIVLPFSSFQLSSNNSDSLPVSSKLEPVASILD